MNKEFKTWLIEEYGLRETAAASRAGNISTIEKYYGDIEDIIKAGNVIDLLNDLSYSTDDERNNRPLAHKIPIDGNYRTGSATLKQALTRYIEFYEDVNGPIETSALKVSFNQIKKVLSAFKPTKKQSSYSRKEEVKEYIQEPLLNALKKSMPTIEWQMEFKISGDVKDSIDIIGKINQDTAVIIEIDTHRADQICKKFVSRQALSDDMNTIYVVLTYPNDNCMSQYDKNSLKKYENYMISLTRLLAAGSNLEKYIYLHKLL